MTRRAWIVLVTTGLWLLAFSQIVVGLWAQLAPLSFYGGFPLPGHAWIALLPPYNEHLVRDVGGLSLALTVVLIATAVRAERRSTRVAMVAFLVCTVPHAWFHSGHLAPFPPADAIAQSVGFGVEIAIAVAVLALSSRLPDAPGRPFDAAPAVTPVGRRPPARPSGDTPRTTRTLRSASCTSWGRRRRPPGPWVRRS